jgi:hypothetical protein
MRRLPFPAPRTPLQQATAHFAEALRTAKTDRRTFETFLAIAIDRLAAEAAQRLDRERAA